MAPCPGAKVQPGYWASTGLGDAVPLHSRHLVTVMKGMPFCVQWMTPAGQTYCTTSIKISLDPAQVRVYPDRFYSQQRKK